VKRPIGLPDGDNLMIGFVEKTKVETFRAALNADAEFCCAARYMNKDILIRVDLDRCFVRIRNGQAIAMEVVNQGEYNLAASDTQIGASRDIWFELLKAVPGPGYNDIYPAVAWYGLELSGDMVVQDVYRHAISRMIAVFREVHSGTRPKFVPRTPPAIGTIEPIAGKYVHLEVGEVPYRVYFEEGGNPEGIPLICQHTAGADSRQWRWLMNDPIVASRFRIIANDLPYHGKSLPPETIEWWKQDYKIDEMLGLGLPVALSEALGLDRPIFMGASISGMIAIDLPWKHPGFFRAVIACEIAEYTPDWGAQVPALGDPRCRNSTSEMGYCQSPLTPLQNLHENTWVNDQAAYGVMAGDVNYYFSVHDLRDKYSLFDTSRTAVYIMNGEYDLATPPASGDVVAAKIPGAKSIALMGLGHFPHCEDYDVFKKYLHPVLAEIHLKNDQ
jgi:pimeloyl-ACP methyl ester carboxylesterase